MRVYWIENEEGQYYGNARCFTDNGPPKLYGSEAKLRQSLGTPGRNSKYAKYYLDPPGTLKPDMIVCSGTLVKDTP